MILRVTIPARLLRDLGIVVRPSRIGIRVRPEKAIVVRPLVQRDGVVARGPVKVAFEDDGVVGGVGGGVLAGELVEAVGVGVEVDVGREDAVDVDVGGVVVESGRVRLGASDVVGRVLEAKILHAGGRLDH